MMATVSKSYTEDGCCRKKALICTGYRVDAATYCVMIAKPTTSRRMEANEVGTTIARVIPVAEKLQKAIAEEAIGERVDLINQVAATVSSTKVDKREDDAHTRLISEQFEAMNKLMDEKFESFKAEVKSIVNPGLLKEPSWVTVVIFALFGVLWVSVSMLK